MSWRLRLHLISMGILCALCVWGYSWLTSPGTAKATAPAATSDGVVYIDVN